MTQTEGEYLCKWWGALEERHALNWPTIINGVVPDIPGVLTDADRRLKDYDPFILSPLSLRALLDVLAERAKG